MNTTLPVVYEPAALRRDQLTPGMEVAANLSSKPTRHFMAFGTVVAVEPVKVPDFTPMLATEPVKMHRPKYVFGGKGKGVLVAIPQVTQSRKYGGGDPASVIVRYRHEVAYLGKIWDLDAWRAWNGYRTALVNRANVVRREKRRANADARMAARIALQAHGIEATDHWGSGVTIADTDDLNKLTELLLERLRKEAPLT